MSNIENELAFGSYVSIPIRTEKTAEQKWIELRKYLVERRATLANDMEDAINEGRPTTALRYSVRRIETLKALDEMDRLDRT